MWSTQANLVSKSGALMEFRISGMGVGPPVHLFISYAPRLNANKVVRAVLEIARIREGEKLRYVKFNTVQIGQRGEGVC